MEELVKLINEYKYDRSSISFQEKIYKYYELNNYAKESLEKLSELTGINKKLLSRYVHNYANIVLGMSDDRFNIFVKKQRVKSEEKEFLNENNKEQKINEYLMENNITLETKKNITELSFEEKLFLYSKALNYARNCFCDMAKKLHVQSSTLKDYVYKYVSEKFGMNKEEFKEFIKKEKEKNKELYIARINEVLKKENIYIYFLWNNEEQKELFLKSIYEYSLENNFSLESTKKLALQLNISNTRYLELIKLYMKEYLKKTEEETNEITKSNLNRWDQMRAQNVNIQSIFTNIINSNSSEEIDEILNKVGYNFSHLKELFSLYKFHFTNEQIDIFEQKVNDYNNYRKIRREQRKDERLKEKIEKVKKYIEIYINSSDKFLEDLLIEWNLTEEEFESYIRFIKRVDNDTYIKYLEHHNIKQREKEEKRNKDFKELFHDFINGCQDDGRIRQFDILDYFSSTNISLKEFLKSHAGKLDKDTYFKLRKFVNCNKYASIDAPGDIKYIMSEILRVDVEKDDEGNLIPDSGRLILDSEKENIINYLKDNNFPVNKYTYRAVLKRYLNGFLTFDTRGNVLKLTKKNNS